MGNSDTSCVGCDESTGGTYRPEANWSLCDSCYYDWKESEAEAQRQCDEYYDYSYGLPVK